MKNYIRAELFRHKKIRSHYILIGFTVLVPILFGAFLEVITPYQTEIILGNDFLYMMYMFLLMGFYLIYPISICAHSIKPKFVRRQLLTSHLSKMKLFFSDIVYTSLMNMGYLFLYSLICILCSVLLFKMDTSQVKTPASLSVTNFIVLMALIALTIVFANVILYGLQMILDNKVISTGIFIFMIYIIPLIVAQLRHFSEIVEKIATGIPFLQILFYYRGESSLLNAIISHVVGTVLMASLFLFLYNRKEE